MAAWDIRSVNTPYGVAVVRYYIEYGGHLEIDLPDCPEDDEGRLWDAVETAYNKGQSEVQF